MNKKRAAEQARAILDFASHAPDFISNAVMVAIEGAAIVNNLPRPFMQPEDTDKTEAPKVAAILAAAGETFSLDEALRATGRVRLAKGRTTSQDERFDQIRDDLERLETLAVSASCDGLTCQPADVLEMLVIFDRHDESEREELLDLVANKIYPFSEEGQEAISRFIERARQKSKEAHANG